MLWLNFRIFLTIPSFGCYFYEVLTNLIIFVAVSSILKVFYFVFKIPSIRLKLVYIFWQLVQICPYNSFYFSISSLLPPICQLPHLDDQICVETWQRG